MRALPAGSVGSGETERGPDQQPPGQGPLRVLGIATADHIECLGTMRVLVRASRESSQAVLPELSSRVSASPGPRRARSAERNPLGGSETLALLLPDLLPLFTTV